MSSANSPAPSDRVRLRRKPDRGHYDAATIHAILDAMPLCTVSHIIDGQPVGMPTVQWREGRHVYWHGSAAARMMKTGADAEVCLTVTILDGLVMARSAMHHSANYRSVMVMGRARPVTDPAEKAAKLRAFIEILSPGRWDHLRPMTEAELKATSVLSLSLDEASAKIRGGPPVDDEADLDTPVWAGVLPLRLTPGIPEPDAHCRADVAPLDPDTGPSWG
jgi:nitroimidazol reductase NimA-like FMN-containing flavoprotein (pyridoxamine 5'-phosphate oxidase superfamily)